jgi:hypothetical protein
MMARLFARMEVKVEASDYTWLNLNEILRGGSQDA